MVKLKDIARETGVSISTVSRILNKDTTRKSSDSTVVRVFEAAQKMGYFEQYSSPFSLPSFLGANRVYSIGCILTSDHETFVSPFFSTLLAGIQNELAKMGSTIPYNFFVANIKDPGFAQFLTSSKLDCAIMLGRTTYANISLLKKSIPNLVYAGVNRIGEDVDEVLCDAYLGSRAAVRYLISLGHTNIGYIGQTQQKKQVYNEYRHQGFVDEMTENNLDVNPDYVIESILTSAAAQEAVAALVKRKPLPTALFCGNDTLALGVLKALGEHGISVPHDVSVIGFDNIETSLYVKPALTTISVPTQELGRLAVKIMMDKLETGRTYAVQLQLPFTLIERESCKKLLQEPQGILNELRI